MRLKSYRYPNEQWILALTLLIIAVSLTLFAGLTVCLLPIFLIILVMIAYWINRNQTLALISNSLQVNAQNSPRLWQLTKDCMKRLQPGETNFYIVRAREMNAYTFGINGPKNVVMHSPLLEVMDADEMRFIIGHELGHIALGHTLLNTLVGGMAGIPSSIGAIVILNLAFRWWNRACEYSCDRAGLIACENPQKAISALIQLVAGDANTQEELGRALQLIDREDDNFINVLANSLSTHPMVIQRIEKLRQYANSPNYQALLRRFSTISGEQNQVI